VRTRLLVLALAAGIAAATASGASPATRSFRVTEAQAAFPDRAYILSLPRGMRLSANQVRVFENGIRVKGVSVAAGQTASVEGFGVALLIDASQSMEGRPELAALAAARAFAAQRQAHEQVAVLTYNVEPNVLLPFTTDQKQIDGALSKQPPFQFGTHMYDAVVQAIDQLEAAHVTAGSIVVLSDGQEHRGHGDTAKHETAKTAAAAARAAHVRVFTVGLKSRFFRPKALRELSRRTGGQFLGASSLSQLNEIYRSLGSKLAREYLISYRSNANPGLHIVVSVRVDGFPRIVTSGYTTPKVPGHHKKPGPYHESFLHKLFTSPLMMVVIALVSASLVALAVIAVASSWRRGTLQKRMSEFVSMPAPERERPSGVLAAGVEGGTSKILEGTRWWGRFTAMLELAGIAAPPERIILFTLIGTFLLIWILSVILGSTLLAIAIGFLLPFAVRAYIRRKVDRKRKAFAEQLPDNLQVLASALRAGHSFIGALSVVVEDAPDPSRTEFRRVVADEQLGVPLEDALHVVVERMESRELEQVALVAAVQRQSGGNTAEVLDRVTDTIRERFELRRTVQTLTAQGRLSRWIVSFLPLFLLLVFTLINPKYMHVLYTSTGGRVSLGVAAVMVVAGSLVIKKIINIKV
jgi:tight adherence protein B